MANESNEMGRDIANSQSQEFVDGFIKKFIKETKFGKLLENQESLYSKLGSVLDSFNDELKGIKRDASRLLSNIEKLAYNLNTDVSGINELTKNLNKALGTNVFTSVEDVYNKMSNLITSGITFNVEQRAFVAQIADDIGAQFSHYVSTLNNLTRIYGEDVTARGLAMETSMKEYLTKAYNDSEYLLNQFSSVVSSLYEAQTWMSSEAAFSLEATIQKWLGSFYSEGGTDSTTQGLAQALGYLASGNVSALTNNQYRDLILMGASRTGLSYADMLINGVTADTANTLMEGIMDYIASLGDANAVVRSEFARIFGITVSDIKAAGNVAVSEVDVAASEISTNIYDSLFSKLGEYIPGSLFLDNYVKNLKFSLASNLASNELAYGMSTILEFAGDLTGILVKATGSGWAEALDIVVKGGEALSVLAPSFGSTLSLSAITNLVSALEGLIGWKGDIGVIDAYEALGVNRFTSSGVSSSGSYIAGDNENIVSSGISSESLEEYVSQVPVEATLDDVIASINSLAGITYASTVKINSEANSVTLVDGERNSLERYTMTSAIYTVNIYELLKAAFSGGRIQSIDVTTYNLDEYIDGLKEQTSVEI